MEIFTESFWYIAPMLMALTIAVSGVVNGAFKITSPTWAQIISWIIGAIVTVVAYFLELVEVGEPQWLSVIALAVVVGLSSNGIYDIPTIKAWVGSWFGRKEIK